MAIQLTLGPVARAKNGVIGKDGDLPWRLKTDMAHFKALTLGKPVIMGANSGTACPANPARPHQHRALPRRDRSNRVTRCSSDDFSEAVQIAREQAETRRRR